MPESTCTVFSSRKLHLNTEEQNLPLGAILQNSTDLAYTMVVTRGLIS